MSNVNNKIQDKPKVIVTVEKLTHEGRGFAHHHNKPVFVTGALPNETVEVQIHRRNKRQMEGFAVEVSNHSSSRVSAKCPHFTQCGGCSLQHISPNEQIAHKQTTFLEQFQHMANCQPEEQLPALTGPAWGYRFKARLGVRWVNAKNKVCLGFRERNGRYITDMQRCDILHPRFSQLIPALADCVSSLSIAREIPQFECAAGDDAIALIMRHLKPLSEDDLNTLKQFATAHDLHFYTQAKGLDSIQRLVPVDNTPQRLHYALPDQQLEMAFYPTDFTQVNPVMNRKMINQALALLAPTKDETILDLFCGLGNFTLPFAVHAKEVVGVEMSKAMVERGYENAKRNGIDNVNFYQADLTKEWTHHNWAKQSYDIVIFDPPRSGAIEIVKQIHHLQPKKIGYISCHPSTLARDAQILVQEHGYRCTHAGVMDMFPHTHHVEAMAIFEKHG